MNLSILAQLGVSMQVPVGKKTAEPGIACKSIGCLILSQATSKSTLV